MPWITTFCTGTELLKFALPTTLAPFGYSTRERAYSTVGRLNTGARVVSKDEDETVATRAKNYPDRSYWWVYWQEPPLPEEYGEYGL